MTKIKDGGGWISNRIASTALVALISLVAGCGGGSGATNSGTSSIVATTNPTITPTTNVVLKCPPGQTAASGVCFNAPTILPSSIYVHKEDAFRLSVTDIDGKYPVVVSTNAMGSGGTITPVLDFRLNNPEGISVTDSTGINIPATAAIVSSDVPGVMSAGIIVTLKNKKVEYGKKYIFTLSGVVSQPNQNPLISETVSFTTPITAWVPPNNCGVNKASSCLIDSACTITNKCRLMPESKHFVANKADPSLIYVISNLAPLPSQGRNSDSISVYPAHSVSGSYINKVVPSSNGFFPNYGTTSGLIEYVFFGTDGFLYFSSIFDRTASNSACMRLNLWGDGGVSAGRAAPDDSVCTNGPPSSWSIPVGREITTACSRTRRCVVDKTSVYFAESPYAIKREVGIGQAIMNTTTGYFPVETDTVGYVEYYRNLGPEIANGRFVFSGAFNPSYRGAVNKLGPIRSVFWDSGVLYYELNQPSLCMRFGDGVASTINGEVPVAACPQ